ncbi:hypothetical protein QYE76_027702 [Lolium multiflorum]|uniref:Integrase catalytic domain-containing protein n=1 Tax=Lolium multiflorum TaxID=4521 RepID=A0AAD8QL84_LOLMU|nr:hypothetical protein QYE76_027702 [Lolium multiflorum]
MDFINDNAGCFANGGIFPRTAASSSSAATASTSAPSLCACLSPVLVAPDPPRWLHAGRAPGSVEVMMAGAVDAGKEAAEEGAGRAVSTRAAKPPLERGAGAAGASSAPPETPLQAAMNVLATPIAQNIDPARLRRSWSRQYNLSRNSSAKSNTGITGITKERHGFYWPTALENAEDLVRKCNGCQKYAKQNHTPASGLKTIPLTWPFAVWCLDMVGPFKTARSSMTHILVMVDKFTKWLEVKPIAKCDGHTAVKFLKDVILRYGYPHSIITDNGTNFAQGSGGFRRSIASTGITQRLLLVEIVLDVRRERDEGAHIGAFAMVRAILPLSGEDRVQIGFRAFAHPVRVSKFSSQIPRTPVVFFSLHLEPRDLLLGSFCTLASSSSSARNTVLELPGIFKSLMHLDISFSSFES